VHALATAVGALRGAGLSPVVLKGAPLAQHVHGDPTVRPMSDCDLYLPYLERESAGEVLGRLGWVCTQGEAPAEETFERLSDGRRHRLEVHSAALDDPLLSHICLPIEHDLVQVLEYELPAQSGAYLPAFLATHLAKHQWTPLLWIIDFAAIWNRLDDSERRRAERAASRVGLKRHLRWAIRLASATAMSLDSDAGESALRLLETQLRAIGDIHRVSRLVRLSSTPLDALRVLSGRAWPPEWRDGWRHIVRNLARRTAGWMYWHFPFEERGNGDALLRQRDGRVSLELPDARERLSRALGGGTPMWVDVRDSSMQPAVPEAAKARIAPPNADGVVAGDVVLVRLAHGLCVFRRVMRSDGEQILVRADARTRSERTVPKSSLVGVCDLVEVGGAVWRIEDRPFGPIGVLRQIVRHRIRPAVGASAIR
jgi:hypothetical protein